MQRYILEPDDEILLLKDDEGTPETVELFSGKRMLFFDLSSLFGVQLVHGVPAVSGVGDALRFAADDLLLQRQTEIFVPEKHKNYVNFKTALTNALHLAVLPELDFAPNTCKQNGVHE